MYLGIPYNLSPVAHSARARHTFYRGIPSFVPVEVRDAFHYVTSPVGRPVAPVVTNGSVFCGFTEARRKTLVDVDVVVVEDASGEWFSKINFWVHQSTAVVPALGRFSEHPTVVR